MSGPGNPENEPARARAETVDQRTWRPTAGSQPGSVQRSEIETPRAVRRESATSEFGNPGGLWLG